MSFAVACPGCRQQLSATEALRGKVTKCAVCGALVEIPRAEVEQPLFVAEAIAIPPVSAAPLPKAVEPSTAEKVFDGVVSAHRTWKRFLFMARVSLLLVMTLVVLLVFVYGFVQRQFGGEPVETASSSRELHVTSIERAKSPLAPPRIVPLPFYTPENIRFNAPRKDGVRTWVIDTAFTREQDNPEWGVKKEQVPVTPGQTMKLRIFVPENPQEIRSLPCVLLAPSGDQLFFGATVEKSDNDPFARTLARANYVVVMYSLDGPDPSSWARVPQRRAYESFKEAKAGVINGCFALEYATKNLLEVDPNRFFAAGYGSGGTTALLLTAHELQIRGCVALAPYTNAELCLEELTRQENIDRRYPGLLDFARDITVGKYISFFRSPVFICRSRNDSNEPFARTEAFVDAMHQAGKKATFLDVDGGGDYQRLVRQAAPAAIEWMNDIGKPFATNSPSSDRKKSITPGRPGR